VTSNGCGWTSSTGVYRECDYAVFPMTIHPDVSGRPDVLLMHGRLIEYMNGFKGVRGAPEHEMATDFITRNRPAQAQPSEGLDAWPGSHDERPESRASYVVIKVVNLWVRKAGPAVDSRGVVPRQAVCREIVPFFLRDL
jgi:hypothetical protein